MKQQSQPQQQQQDQKPKIGQGRASAMFRAGFKELSSIVPAFPDSVKPVEEMGLVGNKLPHEVYTERHQMDRTQGRMQPNHDQHTHQPQQNAPTIDDILALSM